MITPWYTSSGCAWAQEDKEYRPPWSSSQEEAKFDDEQGPKIDVRFSNQSLESVVSTLAMNAQETILLGATASKILVTVNFSQTPFIKALELLASTYDLQIVREDGAYLLIGNDEYQQSHGRIEYVWLKMAGPDAVKSIIESLKLPTLTVSVDERSRMLVLRGAPESTDQARALAKELDRSLERRTFALKHAQAEEVGLQLQMALAESVAGGTTGARTSESGLSNAMGASAISSRSGQLNKILVNARANQVIVQDTEENIALCEQLIESLDVPLVETIYKIRYASVETVAQTVQDSLGLRDSISSVASGSTPGGSSSGSRAGRRNSLVWDERSNQIIMRDTAENTSKCATIIESLDVPVKTRVFSTGMLDPKTVAKQISSGELGGESKSKDEKVQVLEDSNQIIVTDTEERLQILEDVMKELEENILTRVFRPHNGTPAEFATLLSENYPNLKSRADARTGSLVLTGHREQVDEALALLQELDEIENIMVDIEARIMLVGDNKVQELGLRLYGQDLDGLNETLANGTINPNTLADSVKPEGDPMGAAPGSGFEAGALKRSSSNFLAIMQPTIQAQAIIRALESDGDTRVLSNPKVRMMIGKESTIFAGSREPYKVVTQQDNKSIESVEFEPVGVTFTVTPFVSPDNTITLDVSTEFSTLRDIRDGVPVVDKRELNTFIESADGDTIFLGGLIATEESDKRSGLPFLSRIPLLKYLFSEKRQRGHTQELVIVITPRIVKSSKGISLGDSVPAAYKGVRLKFPESVNNQNSEMQAMDDTYDD